jgi:hypothetical protein
MVALIFFLLNLGVSIFKPKSRLEAENAALRQQLIVLQRKVCGRVQFTNSDRLFFIQLYRWCPSVLKAMVLVRPETPSNVRHRTPPASLGLQQPHTGANIMANSCPMPGPNECSADEEKAMRQMRQATRSHWRTAPLGRDEPSPDITRFQVPNAPPP